jgi:serine phosphatase RsbU (regulator of sigma subunit)
LPLRPRCANFQPSPAEDMGLFHRETVAEAQEIKLAKAPALNGAQLAAASLGERRGGDLHDFLRVSPRRVVFGLLDVAGQLEQNRAIVAAVQQVFRSGAAKLFAGDDLNESDAMVELGLQLNRAVMQSAKGIHACPAFAGCYDEELGTVCYFNAGHTHGLVRDKTGVSELTATGLPLGLFSHAIPDAQVVALEQAAALLLVSRGVAEVEGSKDGAGLGPLKETLQGIAASSAQSICDGVLEAMKSGVHRSHIHNDLTALALLRDN